MALDPRCQDYDSCFRGWYIERKQQLERSLSSTIENAKFCNEPSPLKAWFRNWHLWAVQLVPSWKHNLELGGRREGMTTYQWTPGVHFLPLFEGGKSFPQVFSAPVAGPAPAIPSFTDDTVFATSKSGTFQLAVILDSVDHVVTSREELQGIGKLSSITGLNLEEATFIIHGLSGAVSTSTLGSTGKDVTENVIRVIDADAYTAAGNTAEAPATGFKRHTPKFYNPDRIRVDLGRDKKYVIVRWDRIVFAACPSIRELQLAINQLDQHINQPAQDGKSR